MPHRSRWVRPLLAVGAGLIALSPLPAALPAQAAPATTWVSHPLVPASGTGLTRNEDGEPGMGVTPAGQFWVASDIAPYAAHDPRLDPAAGLLSGADVWTSTDGGRTYRWLSDPFAEAANSFGLAGEDTDLAVAPAKNSRGFYNVYATSLWIGSSGLAWSADGGQTWQLNRLGGLPTQDRPWLAADGACDVILAYHQLPLFTPVLDDYNVCSNGNVPTTVGAALDPTHQTLLTLSDFPGTTNSFNKIALDASPTSRYQHSIYVPMSVCKVQSPTDLVANAAASNCPIGTQYVVAVSHDKGQTFTYSPAALDPTGQTLVWAATVASDASGTVYFTWSDAKNSYLDVSTDGAKTWSKPKRLNPPGTAAVYPTVAGGNAGRVDVAWYGTNRSGDANDEKAMGKVNGTTSATWHVDVARSTDGGRSFSVRTVTDTIHRGVLCTHGSGCNSDGSRNLLDDFGVAISPTTGFDSIAFTDDQPQGQPGTTFTAYASELGPATTQRPPTSGRHPAGGGSTRTSGGSGSLARSGGTLAPAVAGAALVALAIWLRRRAGRATT